MPARGTDYVYTGASGGPTRDRRAEIFVADNALHAGADHAPYLLVPLISPRLPAEAAAPALDGKGFRSWNTGSADVLAVLAEE